MIAIWTPNIKHLCVFSTLNWILSTLDSTPFHTYFSLPNGCCCCVSAEHWWWTKCVFVKQENGSISNVWCVRHSTSTHSYRSPFGCLLLEREVMQRCVSCGVCVCLCRTKRSNELHTHSAKPYLIIWVDLSQHSALCPVNGNKLRSISELSVCFVEYKLCVLCVFGFCCRRPMSRRCVLVARGVGVDWGSEDGGQPTSSANWLSIILLFTH